MKFSTLLVLAACASTGFALPAASELHNLRARADPNNYGLTDNIEKDQGVNCYHFPAGTKGNKVGYRKCYMKTEPCNVEWRKAVLDFRYWCLPYDRLIDDPVCKQLWEPDVDSPKYCIGREVKEDGKGNRVPACGNPRGIGAGACRAPSLENYCPDETSCRVIEPDVDPKGKPCRAMFSACQNNYIKICAGYALPCQADCRNPKSCIRGSSNMTLPAPLKPVMDVLALASINVAELLGNSTIATKDDGMDAEAGDEAETDINAEESADSGEWEITV